VQIKFYSFLTMALDRSKWSQHDAVVLSPIERAPSTQWVVPTARVKALGKRKDLLPFLEHYHESSVV
jgi:hypothetical protein